MMTGGVRNPQADEMTGTQDTGTGPAMPPPERMTEAEFRSLYEAAGFRMTGVVATSSEPVGYQVLIGAPG